MCGRYGVLDNEWNGVKGGREVTIAWFYNHESNNWRNAISAHAENLLSQGRFKNFPHYNTFFPRRNLLKKDTLHSALKVIETVDLDIDQVSLLAHLSAWSVINAHENGKLDKIFN